MLIIFLVITSQTEHVPDRFTFYQSAILRNGYTRTSIDLCVSLFYHSIAK